MKWNIGEHVSGTNRYTGDRVVGTLTAVERGWDGVEYATVEQSTGPQSIRVDDIPAPRTCRRLRPDLTSEGFARNSDEQVKCLSCGRPVWGWPNDDRDWGTAWTHDYASIPARFRS